MDLKKLHREYGQSVWLDYIRRDLLQSGEFARLVKEDGIRGVTSNPSIFEKAIAESTDYGSALDRLVKIKDTTASAIYEHLAVEDLQQAADILRPVYDESDRRDGYVSMEGLALPRPRHPSDHRRSDPVVEQGWSRQPDDRKVPGTPGRGPGDPAAHPPRNQRQRHAPLPRAPRVARCSRRTWAASRRSSHRGGHPARASPASPACS